MENKYTEEEQEIFNKGVIAGAMSERQFWIEKFQKEIEDLKKRLAKFEVLDQPKEELTEQAETKEVAMYFREKDQKKYVLEDNEGAIVYYGNQIIDSANMVFEIQKDDEKGTAFIEFEEKKIYILPEYIGRAFKLIK